MSRKGFENFWYYHKLKVIIAIIAAVFLVLILKFSGGGIKHDVEFAYVTDGRLVPEETQEYLNECFASKILDVTGDKRKYTAFIPLQGPRAYMEFTTEGSQIVLLDGNTLRNFINTGVFEPLDDYIAKYKLDINSNPEVKAKVEGAAQEHTYAIPVGRIPMLLDAGFPADNYYLIIRNANGGSKAEEDKKTNAYAVLDTLLGKS